MRAHHVSFPVFTNTQNRIFNRQQSLHFGLTLYMYIVNTVFSSVSLQVASLTAATALLKKVIAAGSQLQAGVSPGEEFSLQPNQTGRAAPRQVCV